MNVSLWIGFAVLTAAALALDLGVFQRRSHEMKLKEAALFSVFWVGLAVIFNVGVWHYKGLDTAMTFMTAYLIELALSVDNLFVFLMLFGYFKVPKTYQHRVLFWGIIGAVVMRAIFIVAGIALISRFEWLLYVLGGFLIIVGIRMMIKKDEEVHPENNPILKLLRRFIPVTNHYVEGHFVAREAGRLMVTPLFVVLVAVETTDVIFAVDSIPAVLAISLDPFVVFTSNIFAILGLRSFYFLLSGIMPFFHYLHYGVSGILVFIGVKMLISKYYHVPIALTLGLMAALIFGSMVISILRPKPSEVEENKEAV
jgi:tellurite resistance protein TerC